MLGALESNGRVVVCDLEAGVGTLVRMDKGSADVVLVIAEPSTKSIEAARRAADIAAAKAGVVVVANRVRDESEIDAIRAVLGGHEMVVVPEDASIAGADRRGVAPIDVDPDSPGVRAIGSLAERLTATVA